MTKKSLLVRPSSWIGSVFNERDSFVNSFDQIFDEMLKTQFPEAFSEIGANPIGRAAYPKVNVIAKENSLVIEAELAGLKKEEIDLDVKDTILTISGKASSTEQEENTVYVIRELKRSGFSRAFVLGKQFDTSKISAAFENGLLTIEVPRFVKEDSNPQKVTIK